MHAANNNPPHRTRIWRKARSFASSGLRLTGPCWLQNPIIQYSSSAWPEILQVGAFVTVAVAE